MEGHIRHALEGLKNELISCQELQDQVRKLTSDHAALQQNQQAQSSHVSSLEARRNELEVALAGAKERLAEYEAKLRDAAARPVVDIGVAKRLQQAENELTELRTERDRLQSEVDHEKETHNAGTEQLNGLLSESSTMRSDLQRLNEMIAAREEKEAAMKLEVCDDALRMARLLCANQNRSRPPFGKRCTKLTNKWIRLKPASMPMSCSRPDKTLKD